MGLDEAKTTREIPDSCTSIVVSGIPDLATMHIGYYATLCKTFGGQASFKEEKGNNKTSTMTVDRSKNPEITEFHKDMINVFSRNNPQCEITFY